WEHPLLILLIILHQDYKLEKFQSTNNNLTWTHIVKILMTMKLFLQFNGNLMNYWDSTAGIGPELAKVAIHIHGVCVNSASVERSKIQHLHMPIVEKDLNSSSQVNIIKTDENIDNEDDLFLNEFDESYSEKQIQKWNIFIEEWIRTIEYENKCDDSNDEIFLTDEMDNDFNFGGKFIHPADDQMTK
ncbi:12761_t:CDS:2, partial [Dentiscutata erythropus]